MPQLAGACAPKINLTTDFAPAKFYCSNIMILNLVYYYIYKQFYHHFNHYMLFHVFMSSVYSIYGNKYHEMDITKIE